LNLETTTFLTVNSN